MVTKRKFIGKRNRMAEIRSGFINYTICFLTFFIYVDEYTFFLYFCGQKNCISE